MSFRQQLSTLKKPKFRRPDPLEVCTLAVYLVSNFVQQRPVQMLCDLYAAYVIAIIGIVAVYRREWPTRQWLPAFYAALILFAAVTYNSRYV